MNDGNFCDHTPSDNRPFDGGARSRARSCASLLNGPREDPESKAHDLGVRRILLSETFAYFGSKAVDLPQLKPLIVQRGHRNRFSNDLKAEFFDFVGAVGFGVRAAPRSWPSGDESCVQACGGPSAIKR